MNMTWSLLSPVLLFINDICYVLLTGDDDMLRGLPSIIIIKTYHVYQLQYYTCIKQ